MNLLDEYYAKSDLSYRRNQAEASFNKKRRRARYKVPRGRGLRLSPTAQRPLALD